MRAGPMSRGHRFVSWPTRCSPGPTLALAAAAIRDLDSLLVTLQGPTDVA